MEVRRMRMGFFNRIILDDVCLYDQQDSLMLQAPRLAAKLEILPIFDHKIRINNAQIIGAQVSLYQQNENEDFNFTYLLKAFAGKDTTQKNPINLRIGSLLMRNCDVRFNRWQEPLTPGRFNLNHLNVEDFNITATLRELTPDSINATIKRLDFRETNSLEVTKAQMKLAANRNDFKLSELFISLPNTEVSIPSLTATYSDWPQKGETNEWLRRLACDGSLEITTVPNDLVAFVPQLVNFHDPVKIASRIKGKDSQFSLLDLHVQDTNENLVLNGRVDIKELMNELVIESSIANLHTGPQLQQFLMRNLKNEDREISPLLTRLGATDTKGTLSYASKNITLDLDMMTALGNVAIEGILNERNNLNSIVRISDFELGKMLSSRENNELDKVSLEGTLTGKIKGENELPELTLNSTIQEFIYKNYPYRNVDITASCQNGTYQGNMTWESSNGAVNIEALFNNESPQKRIQFDAKLDDVSPHLMNLTKKYEDELFTAYLTGNIQARSLDYITGDIDVSNLTLKSPEKGIFQPGDFHISSQADSIKQHINIESPILQFQADGTFKWKNVYNTFLKITSSHLPSLFKQPNASERLNDDIAFYLRVKDSVLVERMTGINLSIPQEALIEGHMDGGINVMTFNADIPHLRYGSEQLKHINWRIESNRYSLQSSLLLQRLMKGTPVEIGVDVNSGQDILTSRLRWNNHQKPEQSGELDLTGELYKDLDGKQAIRGLLSKSNIIIKDTVWTVQPAKINYHDGIVDVKDVLVAQGERYLKVGGRVSKEENDTLRADLNKINLSYIFDIINFHTVDFAGDATGRIYARNLMEKPKADAYIHVDNFTFNEGRMGSMDAHGNWGDQEGAIHLDAHIEDLPVNHQTSVVGTIIPGHKPESGLELNINTRRINLYFLNKFTEGIFTNFQGRATGWCRVFGQFKNINLEGDIMVNEANMRVNALGVDYHVENDSVILRPDNIWLRHATAYDKLGSPGSSEHYATVDGHLMHTHLSNLRYNFQIDAHNVLGYDFHDFGDMSFYGTLFADGQIQLSGQPGQLNVDVNATPLSGSQIVYNVASPETLTEAGFISYVSHTDSIEVKDLKKEPDPIEDEPETDMRINFNLNITPDATMKLLMDAKSGDYINLYGSGHIIANYYNKGKFQMYGTYRVDHGLYKLSIQEIIRKDFQFQPDGTIVFGGDAYQAALNLKATYTVPNVALDDLSATGLGFSNTRVDCVMNITGKPLAPVVTFDFDLPNANEDEKQMVRSMINTEEERNMQVIYLLGIGRFYSYSPQYMRGNNNQGGTAMNSLISSTLSSQFNQMLSNVMDTNNWSFGANLRTGETGWDQLDVEGILSGRLLNNRLLINGNFGYRESYYSTNNFIGDFDVQYLLTPNGGVSLKAYNQTNDRYFIQSSLTTQGIGVQFKRDFNNWKEAFTRRKKTSKKK